MDSNFDFRKNTFSVISGSTASYILNLRELGSTGITLDFLIDGAAECTIYLCAIDVDAANLKLNFDLVGSGASLTVIGAFFLKEPSIVKIQTVQKHSAPNTTSSLKIRTVLDGTVQFDYHGTIVINNLAENAVAHQENKNLVLGDSPIITSIPNLEVLTQQVQCSHGSATGGLDRVEMFYLMSRGLNEACARSMLVHSFLTDDLNSTDSCLVKKYFDVNLLR